MQVDSILAFSRLYILKVYQKSVEKKFKDERERKVTCVGTERLNLDVWVCLRLFTTLTLYFFHSKSRKSSNNLLEFSSVAQTGKPVYHQLPELAQTHVHRVGDAIQPSHPLSPPSPFAFNLSQHQGLFQWVGSLHQVAKVLSFSFTNSSSHKYSGFISFRIDWCDLPSVQGALKSLLQDQNSKA